MKQIAVILNATSNSYVAPDLPARGLLELFELGTDGRVTTAVWRGEMADGSYAAPVTVPDPVFTYVHPSAEVDVYNPATDSWSTAPAMLAPRRNFPADIDPVDGRIWAAGGYDGSNVPLNVNDQFTCVIPVDLMTFGVE